MRNEKYRKIQTLKKLTRISNKVEFIVLSVIDMMKEYLANIIL